MTVPFKSLCFIFLLVCSCGQREELIDNNWILIGGTLQGQEIEFKSTDRIVFTDQDGQIIRSLNFNKDKTIILPGINSGNIAARWAIEDDRIYFSVDSMRYPLSTFDPGIVETTDSARREKTVNRPKEFQNPMRVYGQAFEYNISGDTLTLSSKDVQLWAVRDHRIDDLLKN
jgi:hypothetical protein